jgi:hypothetical protein
VEAGEAMAEVAVVGGDIEVGGARDGDQKSLPVRFSRLAPPSCRKSCWHSRS